MSFDLDAYRSTVTPVQVDDIDFSVFAERPLSEDTLRALRFMHDVESHTVCYLRDLLLTHGHQDPRVTTFLTMWNYEEYWHGVAIGKILEAHGEPAEDDRIGPMRQRLGWKDRVSPFTSTLGSALWASTSSRCTWPGELSTNGRPRPPTTASQPGRAT